MRATSRLTTCALVALMASGCADGLSFRVDERVTIVSPKDRAEISLPLTLEWTARDLDNGESFAVFLDEAPVPPGKSLSWVARKDTACDAEQACPDGAYLAKLGIYQTDDTKLEITALPHSSSSSDKSKRDRHRAVIVLLDDQGRRIGEIAYDVTFDLKRKG